jgi:hypothetical protein
MATPSKPSKRPRMLSELSTGGSHGRDCFSELKKPKWQQLEGVLPRKIALEDDASTNMLIATYSLKSALENLTCLKCGEADTQNLVPMTMSTKRQGLASSISLRCSQHEFNIESETTKLNTDNNHPKNRWKSENVLLCCAMLATGSGVEDIHTLVAFMGMNEPFLRQVLDYVYMNIICVSEDELELNLQEEIRKEKKKRRIEGV